MEQTDYRALKDNARHALEDTAPQPQKLVLLHTGVILLISLALMAVNALIDQKIGETGGLSDYTLDKGGKILMNAKVVKLLKDDNNHLTGIVYEQDEKQITETGDLVISSMPVKDLVAGMNDVPEEFSAIAQGLPYRDYMTVGVLVPGLKLKNETKIKTMGNIVPDNWVYVHDKSVKMDRFQIYNN